MKSCVVNVAIGGWYPRGQDRLAESLRAQGYDGDLLFWKDTYPPGSPTHKEAPYAFKVCALEHARARGYETAIWADCSIKFIKSPEPLFDIIEERGYWFMTQGWNVGQWCSDDALPKLKITRDVAFKIPMVAATFFGLNFHEEDSIKVLEWQRARCEDGSFLGSWTNDLHEVSMHPQVLGHRHDQTALSVVIHKRGLIMEYPPSFFAYEDQTHAEPHSRVLALARGM